MRSNPFRVSTVFSWILRLALRRTPSRREAAEAARIELREARNRSGDSYPLW